MKRFYLATLILIILTLVANYNNLVPAITQNIEYQNAASSAVVLNFGAEEAQATSQVSRRHFLPPLSIMEKIPNQGRALGIDINKKTIFLFENGRITETLPIVAAGKLEQENLGDFYTIASTNPYYHYPLETGDIYLPYYMQLSGELSLHGWPEFPGGRMVTNNFHNDYLRLETGDAQKVFNFAQKNTSVFVFNKDNEDSFAESSFNENISLPAISGQSFLVANLVTGEIYAQNNMSTAAPIASISKLITAITAADIIDEFETITMTPRAADTEGLTSGLKAGEEYNLGTLYYPLLLNSANDVAEAISEHYGSHRFIERMNNKVQAIGMKTASFADPSGLSPQNLASPQDLFYLSKYLLENKRFLLELGKQNNYQTSGHTFQNNNPMRGLSNWLGGKNGFTPEAGRTLLSIFDFGTSSDEENPILIVVLGSENHTDDTHALLNWLQQALLQ